MWRQQQLAWRLPLGPIHRWAQNDVCVPGVCGQFQPCTSAQTNPTSQPDPKPVTLYCIPIKPQPFGRLEAGTTSAGESFHIHRYVMNFNFTCAFIYLKNLARTCDWLYVCVCCYLCCDYYTLNPSADHIFKIKSNPNFRYNITRGIEHRIIICHTWYNNSRSYNTNWRSIYNWGWKIKF